MKVKVLSRHIIKDPSDSSKNQSDIYLTPYEELYQLSEQFIIWFRTAPYRKGLEERLRAFHAVIHQVVESDNVLVPVPIPHLKPQVYILELDMLDDGEVYDAYDIFYETDGNLYVEIDRMREMDLEEFESYAEVNRDRLNKLLQRFAYNDKGE